MRAALLLVIVGCGAKHAALIDAGPCEPTIVYLDRFGGAYDHGSFDAAGANQSAIVDGPRVLPPWPYDDLHWGELAACITDALSPFAITVTETEPGLAPHLELVFTTTYWGAGGASVPVVVPSSCRAGHQLEFVFGDALPTPTRACEVAMGAFAEMTALLSSADNCLDFTSPATDCGVRYFLNRDMKCVDASDQPAPCRCGGTTSENTFASLAARFPSCPL